MNESWTRNLSSIYTTHKDSTSAASHEIKYRLSLALKERLLTAHVAPNRGIIEGPSGTRSGKDSSNPMPFNFRTQLRRQPSLEHLQRSFLPHSSSHARLDQIDTMKTSSPSSLAKKAASSMGWRVRRCWRSSRGWKQWRCDPERLRVGGETCRGLQGYPRVEGMSERKWIVGATGKCGHEWRWS